MRIVSLILGVLAGSATMAAQSNTAITPSILIASPASVGCPIGVVAERRSATVLHQVTSASPVAQTQNVALTFQRVSTLKIEQVSVVVHGISGATRLMPAAGAASTGDLEETFQLTREPDASSLANSFIRTRHIHIVRWVELKTIEYADGSSWHESPESKCRATPSGLELIASKR